MHICFCRGCEVDNKWVRCAGSKSGTSVLRTKYFLIFLWYVDSNGAATKFGLILFPFFLRLFEFKKIKKIMGFWTG